LNPNPLPVVDVPHRLAILSTAQTDVLNAKESTIPLILLCDWELTMD